MKDLIDRQVAIDAIQRAFDGIPTFADDVTEILVGLPSAQSEPHYCRECKWSRCHIIVDKYGNTETYWHCLNWDGGTDEEGYCYEWEKKN